MAAHRFWWAAICVFGSRLRARADGGSGDDAGAGPVLGAGRRRRR